MQARGTRRRVHHADVLHINAALETGADCLRKRLLGGKSFCESSGNRMRPSSRLGALDVSENAVEEALAEAVDRRLDRPGDTPGRGRRFTRKMLQLNFWRPGDELAENEREFRYGVPLNKADLYGVGDGVAYRWAYR
jgi:hypothetical protein